ncbi:MAG: hypothetical protein ABGX32_05165 [Methylococcales bacterium]|jgi:hypothetical protein
MIGGLLTIYVACWTYQAAVRAGTPGVFKWVAIAAGSLFAVQFLWIQIDVFLFLTENDDTGVDQAELAAKQTKDVSNRILASFRELAAPLMGFLVAAIIRAKFVLKGGLGPSTMFSYMNIFKGSVSSEKVEVVVTADSVDAVDGSSKVSEDDSHTEQK